MKKGKFVPPEIAAVAFDFDWDNKKLWALDLPVEQMPTTALLWHFELPFWRHNDIWFVVKPKDVLANPNMYPEHRDRIAASDLQYPMHIMRHKERWVFLDGIHRLAKATQMSITSVPVRKVSPHHIPLIIVKKDVE